MIEISGALSFQGLSELLTATLTEVVPHTVTDGGQGQWDVELWRVLRSWLRCTGVFCTVLLWRESRARGKGVRVINRKGVSWQEDREPLPPSCNKTACVGEVSASPCVSASGEEAGTM